LEVIFQIEINWPHLFRIGERMGLPAIVHCSPKGLPWRMLALWSLLALLDRPNSLVAIPHLE
jgi:hypothetical protein